MIVAVRILDQNGKTTNFCCYVIHLLKRYVVIINSEFSIKTFDAFGIFPFIVQSGSFIMNPLNMNIRLL